MLLGWDTSVLSMHVCWNVHVKGETRKRRGPGYCECHIVSSNYIQDWELHVFGFKGTKDSTKFAQTKWIILNVESFAHLNCCWWIMLKCSISLKSWKWLLYKFLGRYFSNGAFFISTYGKLTFPEVLTRWICLKNELLQLEIIAFILMTFMCDSGVTLYGEITC